MIDEGLEFDLSDSEDFTDPFAQQDSGGLLSQDEVDLLLGGGSSGVELKEKVDFLRMNLLTPDQYDRLLKLHAAVSGMIARDLDDELKALDVKVLSSDIFRWEEFFLSISEESWFISVENRTLPWLMLQMSTSDFLHLEEVLLAGGREQTAKEQEYAGKRRFVDQFMTHFHKVWHALHIQMDNKIAWNRYILDSLGPYNEERVYQVSYGLTVGDHEIAFSVLYPLYELSDLLRANIRRINGHKLHLDQGRYRPIEGHEEGLLVTAEIPFAVPAWELDDLSSGSLIPIGFAPDENWLLHTARDGKLLGRGSLHSVHGSWAYAQSDTAEEVASGNEPDPVKDSAHKTCRLIAGSARLSHPGKGHKLPVVPLDEEIILDLVSSFGELDFVLPDGRNAPCRIRCKNGDYFAELLDPIDTRLTLRE